MVKRWAGVVAAVVVVSGCGRMDGEPPVVGMPYGASSSWVQNDPAVTAAADRLEPILRLQFADSYAGLVLEHELRTVVVYRKPDKALDERVRIEVKDITVVLRDARMSLVEMQQLSDRVAADIPYWSLQGMVIGSVGPAPDGSGITVMTIDGSTSDRDKLVKRYGTDAIAITAGTIVPAGGAGQG
jgi:hypothetical protein